MRSMLQKNKKMKNLRENVFFMVVIGGLYAIVKEVISLIRETTNMVKRVSYLLNDIKRESPQKQVDKVKVDVDVHMKEEVREAPVQQHTEEKTLSTVSSPKNYEWRSEEEDDDSDVELDEDFYNNASYGDEYEEEDEYKPTHPGLSRPDENEPPVSSDLVWGAKGIQDGANTFRLKPKEEFPESDVWAPSDRQRDIPEDEYENEYDNAL